VVHVHSVHSVHFCTPSCSCSSFSAAAVVVVAAAAVVVPTFLEWLS